MIEADYQELARRLDHFQDDESPADREWIQNFIQTYGKQAHGSDRIDQMLGRYVRERFLNQGLLEHGILHLEEIYEFILLLRDELDADYTYFVNKHYDRKRRGVHLEAIITPGSTGNIKKLMLVEVPTAPENRAEGEG